MRRVLFEETTKHEAKLEAHWREIAVPDVLLGEETARGARSQVSPHFFY